MDQPDDLDTTLKISRLTADTAAKDRRIASLESAIVERDTIAAAKQAGVFNPEFVLPFLPPAVVYLDGDRIASRREVAGVGPVTHDAAIAALRPKHPNLFVDAVNKDKARPAADKPDPRTLASQADYRASRAAYGLPERPGR